MGKGVMRLRARTVGCSNAALPLHSGLSFCRAHAVDLPLRLLSTGSWRQPTSTYVQPEPTSMNHHRASPPTTSVRPLRVGIIGAGQMARQHVQAIARDGLHVLSCHLARTDDTDAQWAD